MIFFFFSVLFVTIDWENETSTIKCHTNTVQRNRNTISYYFEFLNYSSVVRIIYKNSATCLPKLLLEKGLRKTIEVI